MPPAWLHPRDALGPPPRSLVQDLPQQLPRRCTAHTSALSRSPGNYWVRAGPVTLATEKCESGLLSASHPQLKPHTSLRC